MLGLKLETDPRWAELASTNLGEILTDHAWCEQKAASNAISLIVNYPQHTEMVKELTKIALEELEHFNLVHEEILRRGLTLGMERKDDYVNELQTFVRRGQGKEIALIDRLLFAAMIEARSCERFRMLSQNLEDAELRAFYHGLMVSEATHYTTFIGFARRYGSQVEDVNARWQQWLDYEASLMQRYGQKQTIHG